jgi:hypothetical protein
VTIAPPAIEAKPYWSGEGDGSYNQEIQHRSNKSIVPPDDDHDLGDHYTH